MEGMHCQKTRLPRLQLWRQRCFGVCNHRYLTMTDNCTMLRERRALFGSDEECITSLGAWQQMVTEARWVGRALYDAEDIALQYTGGA